MLKIRLTNEQKEILKKHNAFSFIKKLRCDLEKAGFKSVTKFYFDKDIFSGKADSVWYDDSVLSFVLDKRYVYNCRANGDLYIKSKDEYVSHKGYGAYDVRTFLLNLKIRNDKELEKAVDKGKITFIDNNWFEDDLYDSKTKEYINDEINMDISDGPLYFDAEYIMECIKCYDEER